MNFRGGRMCAGGELRTGECIAVRIDMRTTLVIRDRRRFMKQTPTRKTNNEDVKTRS